MKPLVSVICLCYNHERFVVEALASVLDQTYKEIEVFIVDDCSTDKSRVVIHNYISSAPQVTMIENERNLGNCRSFNKALALASGKYIIDFATDDVMMPDRIEKQVKAFEKLNKEYGVVFTNAISIDESGKELNYHYQDTKNIPNGEVYVNVLEKYFINPPTMMIRKKVLEDLGGYDESLAYEDFDFWVRSSRTHKYFYLDEVLTKRRITQNSHSSKFYTKGFEQMAQSTLRVIQKAQWLNRTKEEDEALIKRIRYEFRQSLYMERFQFAEAYYRMLKQMGGKDVTSSLLNMLNSLRLPIFKLYKVYLKLIIKSS